MRVLAGWRQVCAGDGRLRVYASVVYDHLYDHATVMV
jgi:hypothetical protein